MKPAIKNITIAAMHTQLETVQKRLNWIQVHETQLDSLPPEFDNKGLTGYDNFLDFDNLTHEGTIALIKTFPGQWKKVYSSVSITYSREVDGMILRSYSSALPPNCRLVEESIEVPEKVEVKPAHTEKKYRIVCNENQNQNQNQNQNEAP